MNKKIGFIGQGWIGKNYADNFEDRGFEVVRYAQEEKYQENIEKIKECDIVFIAVPTPTTEKGFDSSILKRAIKLVGSQKIAVIKSTILHGTTESIQKENPDIYVLHAPEFLTRHTARYNVDKPDRNIIGVPKNNSIHKKKAEEIMAILPKAPHQIICTARNAELIKYAGNCFFYFKNIFFNMLYDLTLKSGCDWETVRKIIIADPRIGDTHTEPVNKGGRGAGGDCLIKDFVAFYDLYKKIVGDEKGIKILESIQDKNIELLIESGKDLDLLVGVYGRNTNWTQKSQQPFE
jgi:nucleotide sugar dehydrogenase